MHKLIVHSSKTLIAKVKFFKGNLLFNPYLAETEWLAFDTSIEPGQPIHPCSLTRFYAAGWPTSSSHLDIPKNDNGHSKNGKWIIQIKKFRRWSKIYNLLPFPKISLILEIILTCINIISWCTVHGIALLYIYTHLIAIWEWSSG